MKSESFGRFTPHFPDDARSLKSQTMSYVPYRNCSSHASLIRLHTWSSMHKSDGLLCVFIGRQKEYAARYRTLSALQISRTSLLASKLGYATHIFSAVKCGYNDSNPMTCRITLRCKTLSLLRCSWSVIVWIVPHELQNDYCGGILIATWYIIVASDSLNHR